MAFTTMVMIASALIALTVAQQGSNNVVFNSSARCTTPRGETGVCLGIRSCDELLHLLRTQRDSPGVGDFLRASVCGQEGTDPRVCCPDRTSLPTVQFPTSTTTTTTTTPTTASPARSSLSRFPVPDRCGHSNVTSGKIVGGEPSKLGAWPWIAALGYTRKPRSAKTGLQYLCGGTLITERHVLTAGHCVHNRQDLVVVRLGELDLESDDDGAQPIDVPISKKKVHENYSTTSYTNDIALLTLQNNVPYTRMIHPICLPVTPQLRSQSFVGYTPFVAGWGSTSFRGPTSPRLQELQIPVLDNKECVRAYQTFSNTQIDERVICAGYKRGGKDACQGDSGGPLMSPTSASSFTIIGVVSFGFRCAEPGYPGIYTRVAAFMDWIEKNAN